MVNGYINCLGILDVVILYNTILYDVIEIAIVLLPG